MAIPSGSGTEVMRRGGIITQSTDVTTLRFDGTNPTTGTETYAVPANHIIIIISIIVCETAGNAETFKMWGDTNITLIEAQAIGAKETFIWNDKFVAIGGDKIYVLCSSGDCDLWYTYIDQNWS